METTPGLASPPDPHQVRQVLVKACWFLSSISTIPQQSMPTGPGATQYQILESPTKDGFLVVGTGRVLLTD